MNSVSLDKVKQNSVFSEKIHSHIAMTLLLTSLGILFATLFLVYAILRSGQDMWPPMGQLKPPLTYPLASTIFIILSSAFYEWFKLAIKKGNKVLVKISFFLSFAFGCAFILSQMSLWNQLKGMGYYVSQGTLSSLIYSFTWIHAGHVFFGIAGLLWIFFHVFFDSAWAAITDAKIPLKVSNIGIYWHFLAIVWLLIFFSLFVF